MNEMKAETGAESVPHRLVLEGLRANPKTISSKYFYDTRGSELFEEITHLDEYYLTRTELALLESWGGTLISQTRPACIVELGAGSARKTRTLLREMLMVGSGSLFIPVDVSGDFLRETASKLELDFPGLHVRPHVADITDRLILEEEVPRPGLFLLLGSTIGNFDPEGVIELLGHVRDAMRPGDHFLMGADLRPGLLKSKERLEAAYNDRAGVTAEFNRNVLNVLNRRVGSNFDPSAFDHLSFYNEEEGRMEMYLTATSAQAVSFPDGSTVTFAAGERVRTEISCKYDRPTIEDLFSKAGLELLRWCGDDAGLYAVVLGGCSP